MEKLLKPTPGQFNLDLNNKDILAKFLLNIKNQSKKLNKKNTTLKKQKNKVSLLKYIEHLKTNSESNSGLKDKFEKIKKLRLTQKRKYNKLRYLKVKGRSSLISNYRNIFKNFNKTPEDQVDSENFSFDLEKTEEVRLEPKSDRVLENLHLSITVKSNNIFTVLHDMKENKILNSTSAEQLGFTVSKKRLNTIAPLYVTRYFKNLKSDEDLIVTGSYDILTVKIIAPVRIRKKILKTIRDKFIFNSASNIKANFGFFEVPYLKTFNGCKPIKKVRKKKKGLTLYK